MTECIIPDCIKPQKTRKTGLCSMHTARVSRHGDPSIRLKINGSGENIGYRAAHNRVDQAKGDAERYSCVDCGQVASEWSYTNDDPAEKIEHGLRYSVDPQFYVARCRRCHKRYDRTGIYTSRYQGVAFEKDRNKWRVWFQDGQRIIRRRFDTEKEAASYYASLSTRASR